MSAKPYTLLKDGASVKKYVTYYTPLGFSGINEPEMDIAKRTTTILYYFGQVLIPISCCIKSYTIAIRSLAIFKN